MKLHTTYIRKNSNNQVRESTAIYTYLCKSFPGLASLCGNLEDEILDTIHLRYFLNPYFPVVIYSIIIAF